MWRRLEHWFQLALTLGTPFACSRQQLAVANMRCLQSESCAYVQLYHQDVLSLYSLANCYVLQLHVLTSVKQLYLNVLLYATSSGYFCCCTTTVVMQTLAVLAQYLSLQAAVNSRTIGSMSCAPRTCAQHASPGHHGWVCQTSYLGNNDQRKAFVLRTFETCCEWETIV
ncbi:hypothetical protein ABBQ32_012302 [Trebouxia sp. C0010 RCD-2024]